MGVAFGLEPRRWEASPATQNSESGLRNSGWEMCKVSPFPRLLGGGGVSFPFGCGYRPGCMNCVVRAVWRARLCVLLCVCGAERRVLRSGDLSWTGSHAFLSKEASGLASLSKALSGFFLGTRGMLCKGRRERRRKAGLLVWEGGGGPQWHLFKSRRPYGGKCNAASDAAPLNLLLRTSFFALQQRKAVGEVLSSTSQSRRRPWG